MVFICLKEYYQKTSHEKEVNYSFFEELNYFPFIVDAARQIVEINKANKEERDRNDAEKEKSAENAAREQTMTQQKAPCEQTNAEKAAVRNKAASKETIENPDPKRSRH